MKNTIELLRRLIGAKGVSGDEADIADIIAKELSSYDVKKDALGNLIAEISKDGKVHIMLDAHMDTLGFIVTAIDKSGFLKVAGVGGNDARLLAAADVTVYGKKPLFGIIISTPPHLLKADDKDAKPIDEIAIDLGLPFDEVENLVSVGDRVIINSKFYELKNDRVTSAFLDDRAGVAVLIRAIQILESKEHSCKVTAVFSSREEVGGQGAMTAAYANAQDMAIAVDVSFANAPGVSDEKGSPLGGGPIISYAPVLSFDMSNRLIEIAKEENLPYSIEVSGRDTGTNADSILKTKDGVETAVISIPQRNMHSAVEIVDVKDIEAAAKLIASYVCKLGKENF